MLPAVRFALRTCHQESPSFIDHLEAEGSAEMDAGLELEAFLWSNDSSSQLGRVPSSHLGALWRARQTRQLIRIREVLMLTDFLSQRERERVSYQHITSSHLLNREDPIRSAL